jgi:hypothetical protein
MIETSQLSIQELVVHHVGCHAEGESCRFSRKTLNQLDEELVEPVLIQYFFKPFNKEAYFHFSTDEGQAINPVLQVVETVFDNPAGFYEASVQLAQRLYDSSNHPKIKGGEFYMAYFKNCVVDGEVVDGIGIFKSENKETFLKVYLKDQDFELGAMEGINIKKLDKGCIVFNTERDLGFKVCSVDNINRGQEAQFWMIDFLGLKPREDNYFYTNNYLSLCKNFVGEVFNDENDVPRPDQIEMLNRSMDFFSKNNNFKEADFEKEVIRQPEAIEAFQDYKTFFESEHNIPLQSEFDISKSAVKGEKKHFKSVLKLDKNFHVYVHGKRQYIEKGYDNSRGLNFYKLFFETEN